jgi:hypothetical protein
MKAFGAVIIFLLTFLAVVVIIVLYHIRKFFIRIRKHLTGDLDDEDFKRMADKHYRGHGEGPQFDKDYFKGTGSNRKGYSSQRPGTTSEQSTQKTSTTTSEGVTIVDERSQEERKKIFDQDEGEYVEFTEE